MKAVSIFPTPVGIDNIKSEIDIKEIQSIFQLIKNKNKLIQNKSLNFYFEDVYILKSLPSLQKIILEKCHFFIKEIMGETNSSLRITQSWINVNPKNSFHHDHSHSNSILSGVLYLYVNKDTGNINFIKNKPRKIHNAVEAPNEYTYEYMYFTPSIMDLYIFESDLTHSVDVNRSDEDRISLSFNTFYDCDISGKESYLTKLNLSNK